MTKRAPKAEKHPDFFKEKAQTLSLISKEATSECQSQFHLLPLIKPRTSLSTILRFPTLSEPLVSKQMHYIFNWTQQNPWQ